MRRRQPTIRRRLLPLPALLAGLATVVGAGIGSGLGCAASNDEPPVLAGQVRVGIQDNSASALLYIAESIGAFRAAGVDCLLLRYPSGKLALEALSRGEVELVTVADMPIMRRGFEAADVAVIATVATTDRGAWVAARRDRGIQTAADLAGKRIGTQGNSAVHFFLGMLLLTHDLSRESVEIELMRPTELVPALLDGRLDAISMRNPYIADARSALGDTLVEIEDPTLYRLSFNLVAGKAYLREHPEHVRRLIDAVLQAETLVIDQPAVAKQVLLEGLGPGREEELAEDWMRYRLRCELHQSLILTLEDQARWALAGNWIEGDGIPNYLELIDTRFLRDRKPDAVTLRQ